MSRNKGGRKRSDKKLGRQCRSHFVTQRFAKMISGQTNMKNGVWINSDNAGLDGDLKGFYSKLPAILAAHSARNKDSRARRGKITGRRPHRVSSSEWQARILGKKNNQVDAE